jgi:hypothetical protein
MEVGCIAQPAHTHLHIPRFLSSGMHKGSRSYFCHCQTLGNLKQKINESMARDVSVMHEIWEKTEYCLGGCEAQIVLQQVKKYRVCLPIYSYNQLCLY